MSRAPFTPTLFRSFWMGGFESSTHITRAGTRLDMLRATQHDRFITEDYQRLRQAGICTARDTIRWHLVEAVTGQYDFTSVEPYLDAAERHGVQVIWDLLHYGWPSELDVFDPLFVRRFAAFCGATARHLRLRLSGTRCYTPVNEISFFAWAAGQVGHMHPFAHRRGPQFKRQLVRAWIAAVDAIRSEDPQARFVSVEPLIHTVPPLDRPDLAHVAAGQNASQWEAWDLLTGAIEPELGGHPRYLDIVGVNFYHDNQWEEPGGHQMAWHARPRDPRWAPFSVLLQRAYARLQRPIIIGETSHIGAGRGEWLREITDEVILAVQGGVPLQGICLYPIIDRFEWENPQHWHNSGLWDFAEQPDGTLERVLNEPYAEELRRSQQRLADIGLAAATTSAAGSGRCW